MHPLHHLLQAMRRRWRWFDRLARVHERSLELHGGQMASSITLMAFLSLLPLLVVGIAVLGFWSAASSDLTNELIDGLGLRGSSAASTLVEAVASAEHSRRTASIIGLLGLLWTGLGLVGALQTTWNVCWQVQGRGLRDRLVGVVWIAGGGLLLVATIGLTILARFADQWAEVVSLAGGLVSGTLLFWWTSRILPNRDVGWRPLFGPAVVGAFGFEILKYVGAFLVPHLVTRSSALYGSLGVVFALLGWLLILGRLIVYVAVLEVVLWEEAHGTETASIDLPLLADVGQGTANRLGGRSL
jgi:membrane protein